MAYLSVARQVERLETVKGSKFYAWVTPLRQVEQVELFLGEVRRRHPDASHHPYAFKAGDAVRFSDDGEPGGTAGRPMLELLNKRDLGQVLAVVPRYFGGTKLGAGGLVRAYSGSLAKALDEAGTFLVQDRTTLRFEVPFAHMDSVHRLLDDWAELRKRELQFTATGMDLRVSLLAADLTALREHLVSLTRGEARFL